MSYFVPTRFLWKFGGRQVHLCGSFTRWVETVPMTQVEGNPSVFQVVVHLPPGYHQYKFIVDGKWRHDDTAPFMPDPLGNVNNWLFVRRIDPQPSPGTAAPYDQQQQQQQQQAAQAAHQQAQQHLVAQQQAAAHQQLIAAAAQQLHAAHSAHSLGSHSQGQQQQQHGGGGAPALTSGTTGSGGPPHHASAPVIGSHLVAAGSSSGPGAVGSGAAASTSGGLAAGPSPSALAASQHHLQQQQQGDVDMANADAAVVVAPIVIHNPKEPEYTRKKIADFLHNHTAYELIPESGKVVVLDMDLPVRQAFHALNEQGIASAPLWDGDTASISGVISASDFINILVRLRHNVAASGGNPLSEAEMDAHTIRGLRESVSLEGRGEPKPLVFVRPDDDLAKVVGVLAHNKCSLAPVLSEDPGGPAIPDVLHLATLSAVLACLMRHFRASLASLPLLSQPLSSLPVGTWSPDAGLGPAGHQGGGASSGMMPDVLPDAADRRQWRRLQPLHTVSMHTPLTQALGLLLEAGVSALPVVDEHRCLLDCYARSDITALARHNAYNRLQWEDVTVGQALALASSSAPHAAAANGAWGGGGAASSSNPALHMHQQQAAQGGRHQGPTIMGGGGGAGGGHHMAMGGLSAELQRQQAAGGGGVGQGLGVAGGGTSSLSDGMLHLGGAGGGRNPRVHVCCKTDTLRTVVERLSIPGVRRLIVIQPETCRVDGVISLSDVASYLFL